MLILYIIVFCVIWAAKFTPRSEDENTRVVFACLFPFIVLALAFLWNVWARHLIGWPEIKTFQQLVLTMIF